MGITSFSEDEKDPELLKHREKKRKKLHHQLMKQMKELHGDISEEEDVSGIVFEEEENVVPRAPAPRGRGRPRLEVFHALFSFGLFTYFSCRMARRKLILHRMEPRRKSKLRRRKLTFHSYFRLLNDQVPIWHSLVANELMANVESVLQNLTPLPFGTKVRFSIHEVLLVINITTEEEERLAGELAVEEPEISKPDKKRRRKKKDLAAKEDVRSLSTSTMLFTYLLGDRTSMARI